ncbi:MAG: SDR family oxidoreductase [Clostridiales Family XIII bacterium]|jgi:3alpha(or 20beta)-hydroxysteroid dehydrogenase|nr:SDR family oxidoreductase [Clostridiales Family XIII bacterium]
MFSLEGKSAVVTGGGSGLGLATARRFVQAGAQVVVADVDAVAADRAAEIGAGFFLADVSREVDVADLMRFAHERHGRLDIVVNNAGIICPEQLLADADAATYDRLFSVNVMGVVFGIKHGQRYMEDGGIILNTASNSANGDYAGYGPYIASKIAVVGITKVAAIELAPRGIRVNCICPNTIDTPMAYADGCETELQAMRIQTPLARMCEAGEAAALYHFLASDDCRYITGEDIYIDGGLKAGPATQMIDAILGSLQ